MSQSPDEGRKRLENGLMQAYLLRMNQCALENRLITPEIYQKIDTNIRLQYGPFHQNRNLPIARAAGWKILFQPVPFT